MQKVKDTILKKLYQANLSNYEQLIYQYLIFIADEKGQVKGVYYKEICEYVKCSIAQYYNCIANLETYGLVKIKRIGTGAEWNIEVLNNSFDKEDNYKDFCDLNISLFEKKEYFELRAGARRVLMYLVFRVIKQKYLTQKKLNIKNSNSNSLCYALEKNKSEVHMLEVMSKEIGIQVRMCKEYLKELKSTKYISIGLCIDINGKNYDVITLLADNLKIPDVEATEKGVVKSKKKGSLHMHIIHTVKYLCRIYKLKYDLLNLTDVALLILQYKNKAMNVGKNIYEVIKTSLSAYKKEGNENLSSYIVHSILKNVISKDYTNSLLIY